MKFLVWLQGKLPDWPSWAINLLLIMLAVLTVTYYFSLMFTPQDEKEDTNLSIRPQSTKTKDSSNSSSSNCNTHKLHSEFNAFRHKYILVYLIIMLADWMQGTHMYTLYLSYNVNISALYLTGFLSGAIFAPILGSAVDMFGRKRSCVFYCILEIIINSLEHFDQFSVLIIGQILGGVSKNLLFSAFESWMTTEHRKRGFPENWLQRTYSEASIGNGTMAVMAGIIAQILEDKLGHIGPFQVAILLTIVAMILICTWTENYGEAGEEENRDSPSDPTSSSSSLYEQFKLGWKATFTDSRIWRIGLTQALSEGGMYTFVFMWVPTLLSMNPPGGVPTGCVFSSLMIAITMGGLLFPILHDFVSKYLTSESKSSELTASLIYSLAGLSMATTSWCLSCSATTCFEVVLISFLVIELCVGLFNPVAGTLRSKYVPDGLQGGILNIFRLPLNAVVVAGTYATDVFPASQVFAMVSACFIGASIIQASMMFGPHDLEKKIKKE